MAEQFVHGANQLIPDVGTFTDPDVLSPVSSEGSKTIKDIPRLSQSLSIEKDDIDPQLCEFEEKQEVFHEPCSPSISDTLQYFENLQITDEISKSSSFQGTDNNNDIQAAVNSRPHSLSLPECLIPTPTVSSNGSVNKASLKPYEKLKLSNSLNRTQSDVIIIPPTRKILEGLEEDECLSKSLPQGTILRKGDMIEFIADDLQEKIRRSSPMSKTGSSNSRRSSVRSTASFSSNNSAGTSMATSTASGWSRSPSSLFQQSPDDIPPIDPQAIMELENQARLVADNVDLMLGNLRTSLHKMSARSVACLMAYKDSVDYTCDSVDTSIKSMYALMAKCEELNKTVEPIYQLSNEIKEIKRLLDLFESQLSDKMTKPT